MIEEACHPTYEQAAEYTASTRICPNTTQRAPDSHMHTGMVCGCMARLAMV